MMDRKAGRRELLGAAAAAAVSPFLDLAADKVLAQKEIKAAESVRIIDADVVIPPDVVILRPLISRLFGKSTASHSGETVVRHPILTQHGGGKNCFFKQEMVRLGEWS